MQKLLQSLKKIDTYRYLIVFACLVYMIVKSIDYVNAGVNYDQMMSFRPYCVAFGIALVAMMPIKTWLNIWSLIYIPVCYVVTHFLYEKQLIYDVCGYYFPEIIRLGKVVALLYGIVIIAVIVDLIKNKSYKNLKTMNPVLGGLWIVFIIAFSLLHSQYHYTWYIIVTFTLTLYIMHRDETRKMLISAIRMAIVCSFIYVLYKSLRHRPYDTERYMSYFVNSNACGMYFACLDMTLYSKISEWWEKKSLEGFAEDKKLKRFRLLALIFYIGMFGVAAVMTIFNYTRTTLTGMFFAIGVMLVARIIRKDPVKDMLIRLAVLLLTVVVLFYPVFLAMRYIPALFDEPTLISWEYNEETRVKQGDPIDSPKYTTIQEFLTLALGKWGIYVDLESPKEEAEEVIIDKERDVTNGRVDIWKKYASDIGVLGHYPPEVIMDDGTEVYHAHNTYLHVSYMYGLIFGVIYVVLLGMTLLYSFINFIRCSENKTINLYTMMVISTSVLAQMTETIIHPCVFLCFMMYIVIGAVANTKVARDNKDKIK